jgi:hypothetical protein
MNINQQCTYYWKKIEKKNVWRVIKIKKSVVYPSGNGAGLKTGVKTLWVRIPLLPLTFFLICLIKIKKYRLIYDIMEIISL